MRIFGIESSPIEQEPNLDLFERKLGLWLMDHTFPIRLFAYSRHFDFRPAMREVMRRQSNGRPVAELVDVLLPTFRFLDTAHDLLTALGDMPIAQEYTQSPEERLALFDLADDLWQAPISAWVEVAVMLERDALPMLDLVRVLLPSLMALIDIRPDAAPHPADALADADPATRDAFIRLCDQHMPVLPPDTEQPIDPESFTGADWIAIAQILSHTWIPLITHEPALHAMLTLITDRPEVNQLAPDALESASATVQAVFRDVCQREDLTVLCDTPHDAPASAWMELAAALEREVWHLPYLDDMRGFYRMLEERETRSASYVLVTWEPDTVDPEELRASLAHVLRRRVRIMDRIPPILSAPYTIDEGRARLVPTRDGDPYLQVLRSYAMNTTIDATVLHPLMDLDGDVTIVVDIQAVDARKAQFNAETQLTAAESALRTSTTYDPGTEARRNDAERVMREINTQGVHEVQIVVLVQGDSDKTLKRNAASVRDRMGTTLRTEAVAGSQGALLRLFSTTPSRRIETAWRRETMLSHGVGCLLGLVGYHRSPATNGWLWGVDAFRRGAVFADPFADGHAGHMVFLGKTGYGKTFAMNVFTIRAAVMAGHRVIWIDADKNAPRVARAVGGGARLIPISLNQTVNVMDVVFSPDDDLEWRRMQTQHVLNQLALLLGKVEVVTEGTEVRRTLIPRPFSDREIGYLEHTIAQVYATMPDAMPDAADMPTLDDLLDGLEDLADREEALFTGKENVARTLYYDMRVRLYGSATERDQRTTMGQSFCGTTTVAWSMDAQVICFDLTAISQTPELLPFYYAMLIGSISREMRNPNRDLSRHTMLVIDEFGIAAQIETVLDMAMMIAKVARKYKIGLCVADQVPQTFLRSVKARNILDNARIRVVFRMDELPLHELSTAFPQLAPAHIEFLRYAEKGECVVINDQTAVPMVVQPTDREFLWLQGS